MNMYLQPLQTDINTNTSLYWFFQKKSTAKLQNLLSPFMKHWEIYTVAMLKEPYEVKFILQPRNKDNWAKVHSQKTDRKDCSVRETHFLF